MVGAIGRGGPWGMVEVDGYCFILTDPVSVFRFLEMSF